MADLYPLVVDERRRLAARLDTLTDEQWATPSLCAGWTVRDVAAHLVFPATTSKLRMIVPFAKSGFNIDKMTMQTVRADTRTGPELSAVLRKNAAHRFTPPGFGFEAPLTDVVAHGRDIGRPLGLPADIEPQTAVQCSTSSCRRRPVERSWLAVSPRICASRPPTSTGRTAPGPRCAAPPRQSSSRFSAAPSRLRSCQAPAPCCSAVAWRSRRSWYWFVASRRQSQYHRSTKPPRRA